MLHPRIALQSSYRSPSIHISKQLSLSMVIYSLNDYHIPSILICDHDGRESDFKDENVAESIKEEKKRKQMEAIAEDLFNSEKVGMCLVLYYCS